MITNIERSKEMHRLYSFEAKTLQEIGDIYGITRERVRQLITPLKNDDSIGGATLKKLFREIHSEKKVSRLEQRCNDYFGCSLEFRNKYGNTGAYGTLARAFVSQKNSAKRRKIPFNLTFPEWLSIWEKSGHLSDRGFGRGKYHMSRICDIGAYEIDNVEIKLHEENSKEARLMDKVYQRKNTFSCKGALYEIDGEKRTAKELSEIYKIKLTTINARLLKGWSVIDACTKPVQPWGR